ncbi:hypothetical protein C9439_05040, partial [archaeon SCG-AAA382B04]
LASIVGFGVVSGAVQVGAASDNEEDNLLKGFDGDYERPLDGSNSPWVTGDERLDFIQEKFDLTDSQLEEIRTGVISLIEEDADPQEIQDFITQKLEEFGVEDIELYGPGPHYHDKDGEFGEHRGTHFGSDENGFERGPENCPCSD